MARARVACGMLVCLVLVGGCQFPGQRGEWQEFKSEEGHFRVQIPGKPKEETQYAGMGISIKMYSVNDKDGGFMVGWADVPISPNEPYQVVQQRLDGARDGAVKNINGTLLESKIVSHDGLYPGREVRAKAKDIYLYAEIFLVKTRLYQIMVVGTEPFTRSADAKKFLSSIAILP